ncbi:hypothetical protein ACHEVH_02960 [Escherichia coli]
MQISSFDTVAPPAAERYYGEKSMVLMMKTIATTTVAHNEFVN